MPYNIQQGNYDWLMESIIRASGIALDTFQSCPNFDITLNAFCHYLLPQCGTATVPELPAAVCSDACRYMKDTCPDEWADLSTFYDGEATSGDIPLIDCSDTGARLDPLPYCCSNFGIDIRKKILMCGEMG